jgi:hypothetical protein
MISTKATYVAQQRHASTEEVAAEVVPNTNVDELIEGLIDVKRSMRLSPKSPDKCPVFCCFYAEFDIKTGPVVRYQSPKNFMDRDINTTTAEIHGILEKTFEKYKNDQKSHRNNDDKEKSNEKQTRHASDQSGTIPDANNPTEQTSNTKTIAVQNELKDQSTSPSLPDQDEEPIESTLLNNKEGDRETHTDDESYSAEVNLPEGGQSFFDSTSEYIITGSELTGKIITLSTHDVHVMTRPTQITNERYERNALLFSIGMVLRRAADPRPFRPLISKLAMTLRSMEIESGILSDPTKVDFILQPLLEQILISMNSPRWECNLLLDRSTALNLKLFHPPKPPASPVHNYHVPVLLVRDYQLGYYEWDLAVNWVILHIDVSDRAALVIDMLKIQ